MAASVVRIKVDGTIAIKDSYTVIRFTVVATDNGTPGEDTPQAVTITISDINDPPTFDAPVGTPAHDNRGERRPWHAGSDLQRDRR